ncbi:putative hydrolase MhqD [compost metagenome]
MKHIYQKGSSPNPVTFLLLHGTGGTEYDLIPVANRISSTSNVLSIRGEVQENGMSRFFRRLAEGVFDEEDLLFRTEELNGFIDQAANQYEFDRQNVVAIGYSNGANIAGSLLFHCKNSLRGAILFHPMVPRRGVTLPELSQTPIFIGAGTNDLISTSHEIEELLVLLEGAGASVEVNWERAGHQLTHSEIDEAAEWYKEHFLVGSREMTIRD